VYVFASTFWNAHPVFHRRGGRRTFEGPTIQVFTGCNLVVYENGPSGRTEVAVLVPTRHALKFGRPCRRCWP
jgi:hypothetical protein